MNSPTSPFLREGGGCIQQWPATLCRLALITDHLTYFTGVTFFFTVWMKSLHAIFPYMNTKGNNADLLQNTKICY